MSSSFGIQENHIIRTGCYSSRDLVINGLLIIGIVAILLCTGGGLGNIDVLCNGDRDITAGSG